MQQLNEIEDLFVREVLDTHGEYLVDLLQDSIEEKKLRITDKLIDSLDYKVVKRGGNYVLEVSFLGYGRAVEIAWHKSKRMRRMGEPVSGRELRRAKRKDTRFYARNVYGSINRLLGRMASEYSDAEIARLKGILEYKMKVN